MSLAQLLHEHLTLITLIAIYVAIAAVNSLPDPATQRFQLYPWLYHTCKTLLNAVPPVYKSKVLPPDQPK